MPVWPDDKIIFQYLTYYNSDICPIPMIKIAKICFKYCQMLTKPQIYWQILKKVCQSGKISPILVTLNNAQKIRRRETKNSLQRIFFKTGVKFKRKSNKKALSNFKIFVFDFIDLHPQYFFIKLYFYLYGVFQWDRFANFQSLCIS